MTLPLTYEVFPRSGRLEEGVDRLTLVLEDGLVNVLTGGGAVEGPLRPPDGGGVAFTLRCLDDAGGVLLLDVVDPVLLLCIPCGRPTVDPVDEDLFDEYFDEDDSEVLLDVRGAPCLGEGGLTVLAGGLEGADFGTFSFLLNDDPVVKSGAFDLVEVDDVYLAVLLEFVFSVLPYDDDDGEDTVLERLGGVLDVRAAFGTCRLGPLV